jgi:formimidoylglutamate deiminase
MTTTLAAGNFWTPQGWRSDAHLRIESGRVTALDSSGQGGNVSSNRFVFPGMPNLHSHAFQRAMAGLAERKGPGEDSFWTWRESMYSFAARIDPEDLHAIAAQLYVEMLKAGYTHVCEFHYLHHAPDGKPYADPAAMSRAIIEAAREAGIGLTLLPVLYQTRGFDGGALGERQRRFGMDVDSYLRLLERLRALQSPMLRVGIALHSLRAVPETSMREVLASPFAREGVIHIHIAEQTGEVEECMATRGTRPVRWLFDHAEVDTRWCLVHATHLDENEISSLAKLGAVAGLCPTTEANLGDGLFPLEKYLQARGTLGIGSDSHISISSVEELRWLEYGQRLVMRSRNVTAGESGDSVGETLWSAALAGGAQASGITLGVGARADLLVLDDRSPLLAARDQGNVLDSFIFAGNAPLVRDVMVNGEWVVRDFRHRDEERIAARYRSAVGSLGCA